MWVTLYTDGGYHPKQGVAAWAFWATSNCGNAKRSGVLKRPGCKQIQAEVAAIINGIAWINKNWSGVTGILVISDCLAAINILQTRNNKPETKEKYRDETKKYDELVHNIRWVRFRHVKAHADSYINNQVDAAIRAVYARQTVK